MNNSTNNKINLVLASDQNYVKLLVPCIISILYNKKPTTEIDIYILESGISDFDKQKIKELVNVVGRKQNFNNINNCKINFIDVEKDLLDIKNNNQESKARHANSPIYNIATPELFKHLDRALWLDVDTIVRSDLLEFYNQDFENNYMTAFKCNNPQSHVDYFNSIIEYKGTKCTIANILRDMGVEHNFINNFFSYHYNGGTTLYNIKKIIQDGKNKELIEKALLYNDYMGGVNEIACLATFKTNIKDAGAKYNFMLPMVDEEAFVLNKQQISNLLNKAVIYHYEGKIKPFKFSKLYKILPIAYQEFYKYYQMSYLKINPIKLRLIFLFASLKRFRRNISGTKITKDGKKVFYFFNLEFVIKNNN